MTASPTPDPLVSRVADAIERHALLEGVDRLLVACSGGGDSVALVELLSAVARSEVGLHLATLDHGSGRGAAERELVEGVAARHGLPWVHAVAEPSTTPPSEARWRTARLDFLSRVAVEIGADAVAVGHTLDDRAETLLLNLARGSGRRGLGAIRWRSRVGALRLVRPLLGERREALRRWLAARGVEWVDDPGNTDPAFARNRVRAAVVPELERALPGAVDRLARASELLADEEGWLDEMARDALERVRGEGDPTPGTTVVVSRLRDLPVPLARRVVRCALREVRGSLRGISLRHVDEVVAMVHGDGEPARDLPGVRARLEGSVLRLLPLRGRRPAVAAES